MAADRQFQRSTYDDRIKVYQASSNDGGKTWEKPHEISDLIYDAIYKDAPSKLQGVFVTSGKGLCLKHQKRKSANGRILFVMVCKFTSGPYCNYRVSVDLTFHTTVGSIGVKAIPTRIYGAIAVMPICSYIPKIYICTQCLMIPTEGI